MSQTKSVFMAIVNHELPTTSVWGAHILEKSQTLEEAQQEITHATVVDIVEVELRNAANHPDYQEATAFDLIRALDALYNGHALDDLLTAFVMAAYLRGRKRIKLK